jgi:hypothetical protein
MKKNSDVGIGMGVAGLSGSQAVLLVMEDIVWFTAPKSQSISNNPKAFTKSQ